MNRKWLVAGIAAVAIVVVGVLFFLPEGTTQLDEAAPQGDQTMLRAGAWQDADAAHRASGQVALVTIDGEPLLAFTDFEMTAGPDVYLYLTRSAAPSSTQDVEEDGVRIPVRTDADPTPRINERGTFFVALEGTVADYDDYAGVAAWCDDFNVLFGSAHLA